MRRIAMVGALLLACGGGTLEIGASDDALYLTNEVKAVRPDGKKIGVFTSDTRDRRRARKFRHHGGPVMLGTTNVYYVWYGLWGGSPVQPILTDLASTLGGSRYWNIVTRYTDATGARPSNSVQYAGAVEDAYSLGLALSESDVALAISEVILSGALPADPNGVYVFVPTPDVVITSGICATTCGSHSTTFVNGVSIKYAVVANTEACPTKCGAQLIGPNGTSGADAMASLVAAELFNTITDPYLSAYYDRRGLEGADKCAWTYGTTFRTANGAKANVTLGSRDYLLQRLYVPSRDDEDDARAEQERNGACALGY